MGAGWALGGGWVEPVMLTSAAHEVSLGSTEWPTQFNDARPTGDDLHPYETRGAATFLPLIVEHRPHTRSGRAPTKTASMKPGAIHLDAIRTRHGLKWGVPAMFRAIPYLLAVSVCMTLIKDGLPAGSSCSCFC